jgi:chromosomal replication initiator protein
MARLAGDGAGHYATPAKLRRAVLELAATAEFQPNADPANVARPFSPRSPDSAAICRSITIAVAKHFGMSVSALKGKSRQQTIVEARGLAMHLVRRLTDASYAEIGRYFGNRDHTTVLHACRKTAGAIAKDPFQAQTADEIAAQIAAAGGD